MEDRMENQEELEIDLGILLWNFLKGLARFWWLVILLAFLGSAVLYVKNSRFYTPMYRSEASFTVMTGGSDSSSGTESYNFYYDTTTAGQLAKTFPYILSSSLLTDAIEEDLGVDSINGSISAQAVSDSNLITMTVISSDPQDAQAILESAIRVYPEVSRFVIGDTKFNMINVPTEPTEPYNRPNYTRKVLKGALFGAAAGLFLIALYAFFRKTVQTPDELKSVMNLPCVGNIPELKAKAGKRKKKQELSILNENLSARFKENILSIELKAEQELETMGGKILLVTSTIPGEGKSTLALNLAYAAASHGKKVLFIDGDLRKQAARKMLTQQSGHGLYSVVKGKTELSQAVEKESRSGICFLCGNLPARNPASVLNHPGFQELLKEVRKEYELIILDTPPAEMFEDAALLAEYADGILYVIRHDFVQKRRILDSIAGLEESQTPIFGYAFNGVPLHKGKYGYYGYGRYGYGYYGNYGYGYEERERQ
ncbi:MAG: polysaccharide biosynthesis tyrosine autokinase [Ruminococcus sp.]|jgi:succinoglycan biosynthesis transport protein ExoP